MPTKRKSMFPLLGARITVRKKGSTDRFIFGLVILLGLLLSLTIFTAVGPFPVWANFIVGAPIMVAASAFPAGILFQVVEFYEHAAVERVFSRRRVFGYAEVRNLDYSLVRRHVNHIHVDTVFRMRLTMADGRSLRVGGQYGGQDDKIEDVRSLIEKYPKADLTVGERSGPSSSPDSASGDRSGMADEIHPQKKHYYVWSGYREKGPYTMKQLEAALRDETFAKSDPVRADDEIDSRPLQDLLRQRSRKKSRHRDSR